MKASDPIKAERAAEPAPAVAAVTPFLSKAARIEERARKREALLHAAVRMFNDRGFHATSLDDVAASLGTTKPVIYRYLGNKDQVLFECVTRGIEQLQAAADEARSRPDSGLGRLRSFLCRYAEITMSDFGNCVIRTDDTVLAPDSAKQFRALKSRIDSALRHMIAEGVSDGSVFAENPRETAFVLAGALNWASYWYRPTKALSASKMSLRLVDALTLGLKPR